MTLTEDHKKEVKGAYADNVVGLTEGRVLEIRRQLDSNITGMCQEFLNREIGTSSSNNSTLPVVEERPEIREQRHADLVGDLGIFTLLEPEPRGEAAKEEQPTPAP